METLKTFDLLKKVPLFSKFQDDELELLLKRAQQQTFAIHDVIIRENEVGDEFFLILEGKVEVRKGQEPLAVLNSGQFFGEMVLLDKSVRSADVIALQRTKCLILNNTILRDLIFNHPDMSLKMLAEMARRLRNTDQESYAALEQRVADRTRELSALYEVTAVSSESLNLDATLEKLLDRSIEAMNAEMGVIHLLDKEKATLSLAVQKGLPQPVEEEVSCIPVDHGFWDWVFQHKEPLLIPDITQHPGTKSKTILEMCPHTLLVVPMRAEGKVLGILGLFRSIDQPFNVEDVALLASIGDQAGVVVENARLRLQAEEAAVMEERGRLARDLHDSVTQSIYSVTLFAEAACRLMGEKKLENAEEYVQQLSETAQQALKEVRLLVYELRPSLLKQEGLVGALKQRLNTVEERANMQAKLIHNGDIELSKPIEMGLYNIAQEALNNALKHSAANAVTVRIDCSDDHIELEISDDGKGFNLDDIQSRGGVGMVSIRERAEKLGGLLDVVSSPGQGTSIRVRVGLS